MWYGVVCKVVMSSYMSVGCPLQEDQTSCCLLWIEKVRAKDKTYEWRSVWWETKNYSWGIYMTHIHWVARQNKLEVPRDKDEVNKWKIHECDGWAHDPDTMVTPLTPKPTLKVEASSGCQRPLPHVVSGLFIYYYESIKREVKRRLIYEYRCDERLKTKNVESIRLTDTGLVVELEHLKTKTRLKDEKFVSVKGECET